MDDLPPDELFSIAINMLKFAGETKHRTTIPLFLFRMFNCCIITLTLFYIIINFFHVTEEFYVKTLQAFISIFHVFLKYLLFMFYKSDIEELLTNIIEEFWDHRDFNRNVRKSIGRDIRRVKYIEILIVTLLTLVISMYLLRSAFTSYPFFLETAIPSFDLVGAVLILSQYHCFYLAAAVIFSYDLIYLAICARISLQVKLLKQKIKEVLASYDQGTGLEIKKCIEHHQLLIKIFSRAKDIYSVMLLFHYFVTLITACSDLFELLVVTTNMSDSLIKFISVFFFTGQFAYYAIPAGEVAFEFSDIPNAIYVSNWYNSDIRTQKAVLYIMTNSLRTNYFSGLGLMDINVDALGSVIRKTFSFYTILRNLLKK